MHIVIAPNTFKNSLDALGVAEAIATGLMQSKLNCSLTLFPVGDGGDGTASLIIREHSGTIKKVEVHDALQKKIMAPLGLIDNGRTAVIELADASGIKLIEPLQLDPLHATTYGTGELVKAALNEQVTKIIMCIGGSATVDGGTGLLRALGVRFLDTEKRVLKNLPEDLLHLGEIDLTDLDARILNCELIILCDVENKLLGEAGAARIFGPQKGASSHEVEKLEACVTQLRNVTMQQTGIDAGAIKHGGAAGGVAAFLAAVCNARLVNGIEYFLTLLDFGKVLQRAEIVITGEGSIDEQTLQGKAPYGVAVMAKQKKIKVIGIAGKLPGNKTGKLKEYFDVLFSINEEPFDLSTALKDTRINLIKTAKNIGDLLDKETS